MTKYLVRMYLEKNKTEESSTPTRTESEAKLDKSIRRRIGKLFNKRKKTNVVSNRDIWREIEMVVRSAITELKSMSLTPNWSFKINLQIFQENSRGTSMKKPTKN